MTACPTLPTSQTPKSIDPTGAPLQRPSQRRHNSIQLKINRKLYMDESTLAENPEGMARLQGDLKVLTAKLLGTDPRGM